MLTTAAWNAFLKTLEEPPPNTIFVLATTEAGKVLPTVVDRCHRFDFARPSVPQIAAVLRRVADRESISIPDEAVALIARSATGSFRDALGTLEQLLAYSGSEIALDDVLAVLGAADADLLFGARRRDRRGRPARGAAGRRAAGRVGPRPRPLLRRPRGPRARADGRADARRGAGRAARHRRAGRAAGRAGAPRRPGAVVRLLELIADALRAMKDGADARTQLELALLKAADAGLRPDRQGAAGAARAARGPHGPAARLPRPPARARPDVPATAAGRTAVAITAQVEGQPPVAAATTLPGAPEGGQEAATRDGRRRPPPRSPPSSRRRPTRRPPWPPWPSWSPTRRRPSRASPPAVELSPEAFAELWPAVLESLQERGAACWPPCSRAPSPARRRRRRADARLARVRGLLQAQGRGPGQQGDDRPRDPRGHRDSSLRLAYELRDEASSPPARRARALRGGAGQPLRRGVRRRGPAADEEEPT